METVSDFISLVSKINVDIDHSHTIKRHLLTGRITMSNLDSVLKSRDITLLTKVSLVKAMIFPIVVFGCESYEGWTLKNWCFQTVVQEKTLESPLDGKKIKLVNPKGNQSWMFIGKTDAEAEGPVLTHWKRSWCWEKLRAKGEGGDRGWDGCMTSLTHWTWVWGNSVRQWWAEKPGRLHLMGWQRVEHNWATKQKQKCVLKTIATNI